jgi:hypothetical protein
LAIPSRNNSRKSVLRMWLRSAGTRPERNTPRGAPQGTSLNNTGRCPAAHPTEPNISRVEPVMKILALTLALLVTASPVAAQQQREQALGTGGQINNTILPNNSLICIEEMVATFCNQPAGPNTAGYGSSTAFSRSSATSGRSAASGSGAGSGVGAVSSSGISTTSVPACGAFPPPNELCN